MSNFDQGIGSVFYPGIKQIVSANYSRSHGITPDVCQIEMAPQTLDASDPDYTPIEPDGYLLFQFDEFTALANVLPTQYNLTGRTQILLQGCRPDKASVRRSPSSINWTIPIYDRRWKWKYGSFSGHWNMKKNGVIEPRKKKTPRELADMCLDAMGEKNYDTRDLLDLEKKTSLPYRNQIFPEVHWDRIPPAQALNELVTPLGYRVCLGWDDRVRIRKYGEGALLPTEDLMSGGFEANLPETPDSVTILGGITMHEAMWELEAVGLDIDGDWRPIDHLSYMPKEGWTISKPGVFDEIKAPLDAIEDKKTDGAPVDKAEYLKLKEQYSLAIQTVYRCYRLKYPAGGKSEDGVLRKKYDSAGELLVNEVNDGKRRGDRSYDYFAEEYDKARRELFKNTKPVIPGPLKIDPRTGKRGDYVIEEFEQVLPTFTTRAELGIDTYSGKLIRNPVEITGIYFDEIKGANTLSMADRIYSVEGDKFSIIPELGIIRFNEPMFRFKKEKVKDKDGKTSKEEDEVPYPAELRALIATPLKNLVGEPARYTHTEELKAKYRTKPADLPSGLKDNPRKLPGGTDTKAVIKNEIVLAYKAEYELKKIISGSEFPDGFYVKGVTSNETTENLKNQALAAIDVENLRIKSEDSGSGVYAGLKKMELDGAIQQVAITRTTSGGMTTTISRNSEVNTIVPPFDQRQRDLALKELVKKQQQTVNNTQQVDTESQ